MVWVSNTIPNSKVKHHSANMAVTQDDVLFRGKFDIPQMTNSFERHSMTLRVAVPSGKPILFKLTLSQTEGIKQTINQSTAITTLTFCRVLSLVGFICSPNCF